MIFSSFRKPQSIEKKESKYCHQKLTEEFFNSLENSSKKDFLDLVRAYDAEIKNQNIKITKYTFDKIIKLGVICFDTPNESGLPETVQTKEAINQKVELAVFNILDWENLPFPLKRRQMEVLIVAGQVERLKEIISKNDPEMNNFMRKNFAYWAVKYNQLPVLNLALEQLGTNEKYIKGVKSRLLEQSIEYCHEEISIDLIVNKKIKPSGRIVDLIEKNGLHKLSELLGSIPRGQFHLPENSSAPSSEPPNHVETVDKISSGTIRPKIYPQQMIFRVGAERSRRRSVHKVHDCGENREGNKPENSGVKVITRLVVEDIIAKGSIEEITKVIEGDNLDMVEYLKKQMVTSALTSNRPDMLKVAFQSFYNPKTKLEKCIRQRLEWASKSLEREHILECLINSGCIESVTARTFSSLLENHSESMAEQLFDFTHRSWGRNFPDWKEIYEIAKAKNYHKIIQRIDYYVFRKPSDALENSNIQSEIQNETLDVDSLFGTFGVDFDLDAYLEELDEFLKNRTRAENTSNQNNPLFLDILNGYDFGEFEDVGLNVDQSVDTQYPPNAPLERTEASLEESDLNVKDATLDPEKNSLPSSKIFITQYDRSPRNYLDEEHEFENIFQKCFQP
ncbi:MAG: hypothetical protein U1E78_09280 [Gammaproteobacteria bacterium]